MFHSSQDLQAAPAGAARARFAAARIVVPDLATACRACGDPAGDDLAVCDGCVDALAADRVAVHVAHGVEYLRRWRYDGRDELPEAALVLRRPADEVREYPTCSSDHCGNCTAWACAHCLQPVCYACCADEPKTCLACARLGDAIEMMAE